MTAVISKKQAKFARYLANCAFGKSGKYCKRDGKKERTYIASGRVLIWTEAIVPGGLEIEVLKATWDDGLARDRFEAAKALLEGAKPLSRKPGPDPQPAEELCNTPKQREELKEAIAEAVVEALTPKVEIAATPKGPAPAPSPKPKVLTAREKLIRCATMHLAEENGVELDDGFDPAEAFGKIVSAAGDKAVRRYQELLSSVPAYGLTEARIRLAFPHEFEALF